MTPLVDVNIAVYNHAPYLRQTLDSVVSQQTTFPYRILVGDDCSTDGSTEILKEYESKYPDRIKVIYQPKNLGLNAEERNGIILLKNSTAKYIALLDGDDYWSDPHKLQRQVDFLEANPDFSICFHRVYDLEEGKDLTLSKLNTGESPQDYTINDLASSSVMMHTLSVVFRNGFINGLPEGFAQSPVGDYTMHMLNAAHGKIHYLPEPMGVYRKFVGVWGTQAYASKQLNWYKTLRYLVAYFNKPGNDIILQGLRRQQAACLVWLYEHDARETLLLHEPLVKEVLDLHTVTTPIGMIRYSTGLLWAGFWKKMILLLRHNPVGNRLAKLRR
jgi:glycosyltransferase involved in cell wall biosynthesis